MRLGRILVVSLVLACGSEPPPSPAADPATRRTLSQGEIVGFSKEGAHVWRGIPFARPPVGELRWRAPRPPEPWQGVREALSGWSDAEIERYLRGKPATEILTRYDGSRAGGMYDCPQLFEDGVVLPAGDPLEVFATAGAYDAVPTIVGTNRDETKLFAMFGSPFVTKIFGLPVRLADPEKYEVHAEYASRLWKTSGADEPLAAMRRAQGPSVFGYRFDWDEEPKLLWLDFAKLLGAAHGVEIPFVFGRLDLGRGNRFVFDEARRPAAELLSRRMVSYWTQFAATGDPSRGRDGTLPPWLAWDDSRPDAPKFMVFDTEEGGGVRMSSESGTRQALLERILSEPRFGGPRERCAFLRELVPRNLSAAEYASLGSGTCAAFPLAEKAVGG